MEGKGGKSTVSAVGDRVIDADLTLPGLGGTRGESRLMAVVLGGAFVAGGCLGLLSVALPHRGSMDEAATLALSITVIVVGLVMVLLRSWIPPIGLKGFALFAVAVITLSILAFDDPRSDNELFFLFPILYAFCFFSLAEAIGLAVIATAGYAVAAHSVDPDLEVARVLVFSAVLVVDGALVRLIAIRARGLLEGLRSAALTDPLTELLNRRGFEQMTERELRRAGATGAPLALTVGDLDDFKLFNDRCGHVAGDEALRRLTEVIDRGKRAGDLSARLGGEEFALLLVGSDAGQAHALAERLRGDVERAFESEAVPLTISFGVAAVPRDGSELDPLLVAADRAMYAAKALGKNRVVSDPDEVAAALQGTPLARPVEAGTTPPDRGP